MSSIGSFRIRLKSRLAHKPRTPPDSAGSGTTLLLDSPAESEKCSTPYRLPRISPRGSPCTPAGEDSPVPPESAAEEKVWGRFGYEDNVRMPELGPSVHKAHINALPPSSSSPLHHYHHSGASAAVARSLARGQRHRHQAMMVPKFRSAAITPSVSVVIRHVDDVHVYKSLLEKAAHPEQHPVNPAPTPIPAANSRSASPAKSTRSIHWTLGSSNRHLLFDRTGQGRNQGPYSREFTVRCMAPNNWMRMKWGRQRSLPVH
ncbi:uncharacterized protein LOC143287603 [Babylonia areolata]|uniref:uncharacterized protein LOC143287603 n=1 Tax=Babylonia areolata TaxID=304850 RepID=UPI003FD346E8